MLKILNKPATHDGSNPFRITYDTQDLPIWGIEAKNMTSPCRITIEVVDKAGDPTAQASVFAFVENIPVYGLYAYDDVVQVHFEKPRVIGKNHLLRCDIIDGNSGDLCVLKILVEMKD